MFAKKGTLALLTAIAMLLFHYMPASAIKASYVTMDDLKAEMKGGWHQTYSYNGETIQVDIDIELPDIDAIKIVRVKMPSDMQARFAPNNAEVNDDYFKGSGVLYVVINTPHIFPSNAIETKKGSGWDEYGEPGFQAEHNPLTPEDAQEIFLSKLAPYSAELGHKDFKLNFIYANSRTYERLSRNEKDGTQVLNYEKPLTEMGYYILDYNQVFYGMPMLQAYPSFEHSIKNEVLTAAVQGRVYGWVATEEDYSVGFAPVVEDCVLAEEVPLIAFSEVKQEIERLISDGYIRRIVNLRLGYVLMNDPSDLGNSYVLVPVWELSGSVVTNPKKETPILTYQDKNMQDIINLQFIQINAQTGQYYDINDRSPSRNEATYITWDEVK